MSDLIQQDKSQTTEGAGVQAIEVLNKVGTKSECRKLSIPGLDISGIILLIRRYGISISVNLAILGAICFLFLLQRDWIKGGNKDIGRIVEEKVMETIRKNLSLDENLFHTAGQRKIDGDKLSEQKKDAGTMNSKSKSDTMQVDNSKYIIEANRLYEQGNYESAAALYEKGLNKSVPFVNEDFVMYRLGDCYLLSEKYEEALKVFQSLNSDYINSPYQFKSRLKIGECYAAMGEFKKARKMLYTIVAQEGKCYSDEDKLAVVDSYFKIAEYYMQEAERLRKVSAGRAGSSDRPLALK
ncbi:MAG: tetratricopeptide repeat protein [Candidatus Brocadia sp.]|jgi:tetratricopeptide (TPR) repeat protein